MTQKDWILVGSVIIAFCAGLCIDRLLLTMEFKIDRSINIVQEEDEVMPVLNITQIKDGSLTGEADGLLRIAAGDEIAMPDDNGHLELFLGDAFVNYKTNEVPEGAQFVGSKNSNKYHPLGSYTARQIAPENRIYFLTEEEAQAAGYIPIK